MQTELKQIVSVTLFAWLLTTITAQAELLDGTKWKVQVIPQKQAADKGEKEFADELTFADGKFISQASAAKGFPRAAYSAEDESYEIEFESTLVSESEGRATWSGGITKKTLTGKLELIKKDGSKLYYTFKGERE